VKLHPFTAVIDAVSYGLRAGSFALFAAIAGRTTGLVPVEALLVAVPLVVLIGAGFGVARYAAFEYELGPETLAISSGVVRRQSREIPLERVQNVDVEQSALQRLLGLAVVRFETAGGGQTEGELRLVGTERAEHLQADLRRRKRAARADEDAGTEREAPEPTVLYELTLPDLLVLAAVSFHWGIVPLTLFSFPVVEDVLLSLFRRFVVEDLLGGDLSLSDPRLLGVAAGLVGAYLVLVWLLSGLVTVAQYYGFRLARLDDELVYERGLLQRYSGTVPLDKVQSLVVEENVAMRRLGYAALTVDTAGYAAGGDGGRSPSAIPLAARETVLGLADAIEGVDDVGVERPPRRARRRYIGRYTIVTGVLAAVLGAVHLAVRPLGVLWALPVVVLAAVVPAAHLKWANRGHRAGEDHFVARTGVLRRTTRVVPYYRLQTVLTERTVFQRRWNLASVVGDTAASSTLRSRQATAHDVDDGVAADLHATLREELLADVRERRAPEDARDDGPAGRRDEAHPGDDTAEDGPDADGTQNADGTTGRHRDGGS
jgi:putative membrane protein